jgi:hypothetical protein
MHTFALCGKKSVIPDMSEEWPEDRAAGRCGDLLAGAAIE